MKLVAFCALVALIPVAAAGGWAVHSSPSAPTVSLQQGLAAEGLKLSGKAEVDYAQMGKAYYRRVCKTYLHGIKTSATVCHVKKTTLKAIVEEVTHGKTPPA